MPLQKAFFTFITLGRYFLLSKKKPKMEFPDKRKHSTLRVPACDSICCGGWNIQTPQTLLYFNRYTRIRGKSIPHHLLQLSSMVQEDVHVCDIS